MYLFQHVCNETDVILELFSYIIAVTKENTGKGKGKASASTSGPRAVSIKDPGRMTPWTDKVT